MNKTVNKLEKISFVVISYNEEKNIKDCLDSLIALDYPKELYEIIVVDSSTDTTKEIVKSFKDVKLINSHERYVPIVRNKGINEAKYKFVAFADADCIVPAEWPRKIIPSFKNLKVAGVGGDAFPPPNSKFMGICIASTGVPAGGAIGFDSEFAGDESDIEFLGTGHSMFRKNILLEVGGFNENLIFGDEDNEICERIRGKDYILKYEPSAYIYHKTRENLRDFIKWSFRRGMGSIQLSQSSILKLLLNPFSFIWPLIFTLLLSYVIYSFSILQILFICIGLLLFSFFSIKLIMKKNIFPTGKKKIALLFKRRKKIGVNLIHIFLIILPLFYIDRTIMYIGSIYNSLTKQE